METSPELMLAGRLAIWTLISSPLLLHPMRQKIQHWIPFKLFPLRSLANTWKGLRLNLNLTLSLTQASQDSWPSLTFNHFQKSGKKCVPTLPDSPPRPPLPGQILVVNPRWQWRGKRTIRMHGCLFSSWHMLDTWNTWSLWKEKPRGRNMCLYFFKKRNWGYKDKNFVSTAIVNQRSSFPTSFCQNPLTLDQSSECWDQYGSRSQKHPRPSP